LDVISLAELQLSGFQRVRVRRQTGSRAPALDVHFGYRFLGGRWAEVLCTGRGCSWEAEAEGWKEAEGEEGGLIMEIRIWTMDLEWFCQAKGDTPCGPWMQKYDAIKQIVFAEPTDD
jgi:hypothetical protein